jgi:hypothetical protein
VDVVAAVALREFVINLRKQFGLGPGDALGGAIGPELMLVKLGEREPVVLLTRVSDKAATSRAVDQYLSMGDSGSSPESYDGVEVLVSSNPDGRAAAFVGDYLVLGTGDQIRRMVDARSSGQSLSTDHKLSEALAWRPAGASVMSYRPGTDDAGELMLAIAKLTRVSDGSPELLRQDGARSALDRLPGSISFTDFLEDGVYTESRSAVGSFGLIATLFGGSESGDR